jgi:hypothetical protein
MAIEIVFIDAEDDDHVRVGAWESKGDTITVAYLGTFPKATAHVGGHADSPLALAKMLLSKFG